MRLATAECRTNGLADLTVRDGDGDRSRRSAKEDQPPAAAQVTSIGLREEGKRGTGSRAEAIGNYVLALANERAFWSPTIRDVAKRILERVP